MQGKTNETYYVNGGKMSKKQRKQKTRLQKVIKAISIILLIIIIIVVAVIAGGWTYINNILGEMKQESIDTSAVGASDSEDLKNYRNIALLGIDSRADDYSMGNRSDCIIIASIDKKTNDVTLTSVYRDTYLQIKENGTEKLDKVTHAYAYGGAQNTLLALNTNLDLNITEYLTVNFDATVDAIDALGGVSINISSEELKYINAIIEENNRVTGHSASNIAKTGTQTLNGVQALAYSRIRSTAGGDYKRTERMRTVIEAMLKKVKSLGISQMIEFANKMLPKVSTNISKTDFIFLAQKLASVNIDESIGWPYNTKGITLDRWYGVPITLETNVIKLHSEVFKTESYTLPNKIKTISDQIITKTGYKS